MYKRENESILIKNVALEPKDVLELYPINAPTPAIPRLIEEEQQIINQAINRRLLEAMPSHFSNSMVEMVMLAQHTTEAMLSVENQVSYHRVEAQASSSIALELERDKYARGLATPREALDVFIDLNMESAELLKRTDISSDLPVGMESDLTELYEAIIANQGDNDLIGSSNSRVRLKQIDRKIGKGGTEGLILSSKTDIATIKNKEKTITMRTKLIIDFEQLPMKWRSHLRKLISNTPVHCEEDQDELFESILRCPNPDNPSESLMDADLKKPYAYHFATTIYAHSSSELEPIADQ